MIGNWIDWLTELFKKYKRSRVTPTIIQMESTECGAASLGMILGYYKRFIPLEELRTLCGVCRDGSSAWGVMQAAKYNGMSAKCYSLEVDDVDQLQLPAILFWEGSHFVVLESIYKGEYAFINDPAIGAYMIPWTGFAERFKGIAVEMIPTPDFKKDNTTLPFWEQMFERLKPFKLTVVFILVVTAIFTLLGMVQPLFARIFVDNIITQKMWDWIGPLLVGFAMLFLFLYFFTYIRAKVMLRLKLKLTLISSTSFILHMLKLPIFFFYQRYGGEVVSRIGLNEQIYSTMIGQAGTSILNVLFLFFYGFIMYQYDGLITFIAILCGVLNVFLMIFINHSRLRVYAILQMEQGKLSGRAIDFMGNMEALKLVSAKHFVFNRLIGLQTDQMNSWQRIESKDIWLMSLSGVLQSIATMSLTLIGAWKAMFGGMSAGILVGLQFLLSKFLAPMNDLVGFGSMIQSQKINLDRVNDVMKADVDPIFVHQKVDHDLMQEQIPPSLELKNITFGYSPLDDPLLKDLSLTISKGESVAIIGRTGSGKSTVGHLAAGLFPPWSGEILWGGKPITAYTTEQISRSIAIVSQEFFLFEGTVFDNLTFWNPQIPESQVLHALEQACILDEVQALQGGIYGHLVEGGKNLSKGQQQRLEIARALLWNPTILILDEATSALDLKLERELFRNLQDTERATLIITHRLSAIKLCGEVLVLDRGVPIERGSVDDLMALGGTFADIVKKQGFM